MSNLADRPFVESAQEREQQIEQAARLFAAAHQEVDLEDGRVVRPLLPAELETLHVVCHCKCQDWSKLRLILSTEEFKNDQSSRLVQLVSHNVFADVVMIGLDPSASVHPNKVWEWHKLSAGIHGNIVISNCIIEAGARVYHNGLVLDTYVGTGAVLMECGRVSCSRKVAYGQLSITVGPESGGGLHLTVTSESTMIDVCNNLGMSEKQTLQKWTTSVSGDMNIIGASSVVRDTPTVENVYMSSHSEITAASSVRNATLLSQAKIGNACTVSNVLLQWNSSIMDNSSLSFTLLMEEAHSGPHSLVASTILGPDVHVSTGEVHASVLGPNTNAHHQSLLIGVLWPLGRGNVGYGANVGSNHTGRLPDQDATAGEGTFWGLSTVIKFPVDLMWAPYSIVAAGTNLPPQRITMPFSLLVETNGVGNIIPGWVLQNSPYTLSRSEIKFANRRKAKRHSFYTGWKIIRPDVVDMCVGARKALQSAGIQAAVYESDKMLDGIGKNHLTEKARLAGIQSYSDCIQLYALRGLLERIESERRSLQQLALNLERDLSDAAPSLHTFLTNVVARKASWPPLPWEEDDGALWRHQLSIILAEFPVSADVLNWLTELLQKLVLLQNEYAERVYDCKKRDDIRGSKTIPGYEDSHVAADNDPVVKAVRADATRVMERVNGMLATPADSTEITRSRL
jgi:Domain of unknown function (DUF4954)